MTTPPYKSNVSLDTKNRNEVVFVAKLAEQAERYEEMVEAMVQAVEEGNPLGVEERNLLSVAFKNVVGTRRASWRMVSSLESTAEPDSAKLKKAVELRKSIEVEIRKYCADVLGLLDKCIMPTISKTDVENTVFYTKMQGDYYRYLAEVAEGEERTKVATASKTAYDEAQKAGQNLPATNYIRLGLALNFSTYWYDIAGSRQKACQMARKAFDDAIPELHNLEEVTSYRETALILQLLRDNLTLWMSEEEEEEEKRRKSEQGQTEDQDQTEGHYEGQGQRGYYR